MQILMRKIAFIILSFFSLTFAQAQTFEEQLGYLLTDALFYSEKYIIPATDGAVYQASSSWMNSVKKKKKWEFDLGLHANLFIVPNRDRYFKISNSDFQFFEIEGATQATVPTALGSDEQIYLVGDLDGETIHLKTPEGINQETVVYPYLQMSFGLAYGFEIVGRYSTRTKLKKGDYQVYGFGIKHSFSQYFPKLEAKKIHIAFMTMYSNEEIRFNFLDIETQNGNLGLNRFKGKVDTFHFQLGVSKEIKDFEIMTSFVSNVSNFDYSVYGNNIGESIYAQAINQLIPQLEETKWNFMGEVAMNYFFNDFFVKTSFSFGKFANINLGLNYTFNN